MEAPGATSCRASQANRAVLERAGSREPATRGLAHTVGARQIGLHSPVSEPPEGLLALVRYKLDGAAEFHASGLGGASCRHRHERELAHAQIQQGNRRADVAPISQARVVGRTKRPAGRSTRIIYEADTDKTEAQKFE
jgi:hypothetical protein